MSDPLFEEREDSAFSSIDLVGQCLVDKVRSAAFERAICNVVKPHHHVVDVGTGSGILALFAARAGARKVSAVEYDSYVAHVARENIRANGYENIIEVIEADARNCRFAPDTKFDVVLMEMLTTGLIDEFQVQAINNLHSRGVIKPETIFIPQEQQTFAALSHSQFDIYGFKMRMVRHIWSDFSDEPKFELMSKYEKIGAVNFAAPCDEYCATSLDFAPLKNGHVNSVHLISKTIVAPDITLDATLSLNGTVVVPVQEQEILAGQPVKVNFAYQYGAGYQTFGSIYPPRLTRFTHPLFGNFFTRRPPMNWVSPKTEPRRGQASGWGVYANEPIAKGERIAVFGGHVVTFDLFETLPQRCQDYSYQIADDLVFAYLDVSEMGETDCFNHSCDPNAGYRGHLEIVAMRDIAANEEITFDYATCLTADFGDMDCYCGASNCRGRVTGEDWKIPDLQQRYRGYFQPYIEEKITLGA